MKTITTSSGKTLDILWVLYPVSGGKLMIELEGETPISEISAMFENQKSFKVEDKQDSGTVYTVYEGYTHLVAVSRTRRENTIRLTLEKGDAA